MTKARRGAHVVLWVVQALSVGSAASCRGLDESPVAIEPAWNTTAMLDARVPGSGIGRPRLLTADKRLLTVDLAWWLRESETGRVVVLCDIDGGARLGSAFIGAPRTYGSIDVRRVLVIVVDEAAKRATAPTGEVMSECRLVGFDDSEVDGPLGRLGFNRQ